MVLAAFLVVSTAMAQNTLLSAEAQATKQFDGKGLGTYQWASVTYAKEKGLGIFGFLVHEPGYAGIALGPLLMFTPGDLYIETSIGPGIDIAPGRTNLSANGYVYVESKSDQENQKGKFMIYTNPYYSKPYGFFQMTSMMYGISNALSLGLYSQTAAVTGIRTQYTIKSFNVSATVGPKAVMVGIGINLGL